MIILNKKSRDNRANQLNPNNIQYYKSRVDMSKTNSYMPKKRSNKKIDMPKGTYRAGFNADEVYKSIKKDMKTRKNLDNALEIEWSRVKNGKNRQGEVTKITNKIGQLTYNIDANIEVLKRKSRNNNRAKELAISALELEKRRTDEIVRDWQRKLDAFSRGEIGFIKANGTKRKGSKDVKEYVKNKQRRLQKINDAILELRLTHRKDVIVF